MIFDMDGVLIDSMPLHVLAWERYLQKMGISVEDLERRMHGKRNSELVRDLIDADLPEDVIFRHGADKEQLFRDMLLEQELSHARIPGLIEFLERHRGAPMAIGGAYSRECYVMFRVTSNALKSCSVAVTARPAAE